MLVLNRREGEVICIGSNTRVKVLSAKGNQVRLGIKAPRDVTVDREEIHERKQREALRPTRGP